MIKDLEILHCFISRSETLRYQKSEFNRHKSEEMFIGTDL